MRWSQSHGLWLGSVEYEQALDEQASCYDSRSEVSFLGFETPSPTITLGRSADLNSEIHNSNHNFKIIKTDRGGKATLHSPGQLVIFPVIDLVRDDIRPRALVGELLKFCYGKLQPKMGSDLLLKSDGIYTSRGKLGFIGLRIKNHQVLHGISINVSNDLIQFQEIRSCGKDSATHDRVLGNDLSCKPKQMFNSFFLTTPT